MTTSMTLMESAADFLGSFRRLDDPEDDPRTPIRYGLSGSAPRRDQEIVLILHEALMPDDWRFYMIRQASEILAEADVKPNDDPGFYEVADSCVSVYEADLYSWLASHPCRRTYVEDVISDVGTEHSIRLSDFVRAGMIEELYDVWRMLREQLMLDVKRAEPQA